MKQDSNAKVDRRDLLRALGASAVIAPGCDASRRGHRYAEPRQGRAAGARPPPAHRPDAAGHVRQHVKSIAARFAGAHVRQRCHSRLNRKNGKRSFSSRASRRNDPRSRIFQISVTPVKIADARPASASRADVAYWAQSGRPPRRPVGRYQRYSGHAPLPRADCRRS